MPTKSYVGRILKRRRFKRLKIAFAVIFALLILAVIYFMRNVTNVFLSVSEASVRAMNAQAVNEAVSSVLADGVEYSDLIEIVRDGEGDVISVTADTVTINRLARDTARLARENFAALSEEGVSVPLGALTGIEALAGFGPSIQIKIIPVNSIECRFGSSFSSAGINQTLHTITMQVVSYISVILPSQTVNITAVAEVPVAESVIAGRIPDVYLQSGWINANGGLVPD